MGANRPNAIAQLNGIAARTRNLMNKAGKLLYEIGAELRTARELAPHGSWEPWLRDQVDGLSPETARNFINVANFIDSLDADRAGAILKLAPTIVYALSRPSTPGAAADVILAMIGAGEPVQVETANQVIANTKGYLSEIETDAPQHIKDRVKDGTLAPYGAVNITRAIKAASPPVQQVIEQYGISDAGLVPKLDRIAARNGNTWQMIRDTGVIQGSADGVPLADATHRDLDYVLAEAAYYHKLDNMAPRLIDAPAVISAFSVRTGYLTVALDSQAAETLAAAIKSGCKTVRIIVTENLQS